MTHTQQHVRPNRQEARFTTLTERILQHRPVTVEQVQELGTLALDIAIIKRPRPARGKLITFPTPPATAEKPLGAGASD